MEIRRPQVEIVLIVVRVAVFEEERADHINEEADHRDGNGLVEADRYRQEGALHRLPGHQKPDHAQDDRTGETAEDADLARPEAVARILRMAAAQVVGERGHREGADVGAHVPAVREQRHRIEGDAGGDLDDHHRARDGDNDAGTAFRRGGIDGVVMRMLSVAVTGGVRRRGGGVHVYCTSRSPAGSSSPKRALRSSPVTS